MSKPDLPLVSIVTPTYNQGKYICETIESVLNQDYPNIEYIVIDDGSTDNTRELIAKYSKKCLLLNQENKGQSKTLNRGWEISKGSILAYISSDDRLKKECVSEAVKAITSNKGVVVTYCDFDLIDSNGRYVRSVSTEDFDIKRLTEDLVCQPGPGAFFTKDSFKKVGGWNVELQHVADFEFWLRMCQEGNFLRIPKNLAEFRIHDESASTRVVSNSRSDEIISVVQKFMDISDVRIDRSKSLSSAYLFSAKSHFQSKRPHQGFIRLLTAIWIRPKIIINIQFYRYIISGIFRRLFYGLRLKYKE